MRMMYSSMDIHLRPPTEAAGILGRPGSGDDVVSYLGMNLFGTPADELVERLSEDARTEVSEGGRSGAAPEPRQPGPRPGCRADRETLVGQRVVETRPVHAGTQSVGLRLVARPRLGVGIPGSAVKATGLEIGKLDSVVAAGGSCPQEVGSPQGGQPLAGQITRCW
jgi:hypothetical protein